MKIITIVGARPQIIKAAALSRAIKNKYNNILDKSNFLFLGIKLNIALT